MFDLNGADEGQAVAGDMLIVIIFFILIKLMACVDAGSFMCRGFWGYLKVKPDHAFAYIFEAANQ